MSDPAPSSLLNSAAAIERHVSTILQINASTFQEFLDALAEALSDLGIRYISLFAPSLHRRQQLELIASTSADAAPRVWRLDEENTTSTFLPVYSSADATLFVSMQANHSFSASGVIAKAIETKFKEVVSAKKQLIRRCVIEQSIKSNDVNSFLFRMAKALQKEFVFARDISIFLHDEKGKKLSLAATTSELRGMEKKDIYYQLSDTTPSVHTFRDNQPAVLDKQSSPLGEEFDKNILRFDPSVRGFWPISLAYSDFLSLRGNQIAPIGTICIADPERRRAQKTWAARFSDYDQIIIAFVAEVTFVLVQQYQQYLSAETNLARLTHGLGANIEAAIKFATNVKEMLFLELDYGNRDSRPQFMPTFSLLKKFGSTEAEVYLSLKDLEFFLDDLGYQFTRIQDVGRYEKETIDHLHSEVLMPVVNLAPAIAAVNSKNRPQIANMRARGSFELKPVIGNRKGFILVLRNLVENSIKYAKGKTANIELRFEQDERDVTIDYYDSGIGIEDNEVQQVFVEGFRSLAARRTSNRGVGVGLSSSKEVMLALDGDLTCLRHVGGAHFRLRMRKAK